MNTRTDIEAKIKKELKHERGSMPRWMLNRKCRSRRWSTADYENVLLSMEQGGQVVISNIGRIPVVSISEGQPRAPGGRDPTVSTR